MTVSVIVPSFKRPHKLEQCLLGIKEQPFLPDELLILYAENDIVTQTLIAANSKYFTIKSIGIKDTSRLVPALNQALKFVCGDVVVFTDDDTVPGRDWIYKIVTTYKLDSSIGGVGGRDVIYRFNKEIKSKIVKSVGRLTWFGRIIGNHHEIVAKAQEVDFLKGCNMSFRSELVLDFDDQLIGFYRWEQDLCLRAKASGYKIWYDPEIQVKHLKDDDGLTIKDYFIIAHNTTYILLKYLSLVKKVIFLFYTFLVGQRNNLGFVRGILLFLNQPSLKVLDLFFTSVLGKIRGMATFFKKAARN